MLVMRQWRRVSAWNGGRTFFTKRRY